MDELFKLKNRENMQSLKEFKWAAPNYPPLKLTDLNADIMRLHYHINSMLRKFN